MQSKPFPFGGRVWDGGITHQLAFLSLPLFSKDIISVYLFESTSTNQGTLQHVLL